ncbi:MAG: hypothetical protein ACXWEW_09895 [Nitrososphaeraceae archaeon]
MLLKGYNDNKGDNKLELLELFKAWIIINDKIISEIPVTRIIAVVIKVDFLIFLFLFSLLLFLSTLVI